MTSQSSTTDGYVRRDGGPNWTYTISREEHHAEAIVRSVATYTDQEPREMSPLYETIDPDAVNALFGSKPGGSPDSLVFDFEGHEITVTRNRIHIRET